jgi:hypothetical protein
MQGENPYKMWCLDVFEVGLMVVRSPGYIDCAAESFIFISFVEIYYL